MSQLETLLWFGLGFAVERRKGLHEVVELAAQFFEAELQTERDSMRAENAMMARKLEVRLGELKAKLAEQTAEVSRHRNRIEILAADLSLREKVGSSHMAEITRLQQHIADLEADLAQRAESGQLLAAKVQAKDNEIGERGDEIAALKSKIWKLQTKSQPIEERLAEAAEQSDKLAAEIRALDKAWPEKLTELGFEDRPDAGEPPAPAEAEPEAKPVNGSGKTKSVKKSAGQGQSAQRFPGNVVSLAQRIKALQKTITR